MSLKRVRGIADSPVAQRPPEPAQRIAQGERQPPEAPGKFGRVFCVVARVPEYEFLRDAFGLAQDMDDEPANGTRQAVRPMRQIGKRENGGYVTPIESAGEDATYISRIREDPTVDNGLNLWIVSDNLRKGAALNAVQIAELMIERGLLKPKRQAA